MNHVFDNGDGELIAADTIEAAMRYIHVELGGDAGEASHWFQVPDEQMVTVITDPHVSDKIAIKTAKEWATDHKTPGYVSTTNW